MDPTAVNNNVTIDDFDSVLSYSDPSQWQTPDPSSPGFNALTSPWFMGTYHKTNITGASVSLNFTGPALFIYGHSGPDYGSYEVQVDSQTTTLSAYAPVNASDPSLLYGASNFSYARHTLTLRNVGAKDGDAGGNNFLFDHLISTIQVAPAGATASDTTYQEDSPELQFSGEWHSNMSPKFSGGGTSYTNQDKASVSLSFHGTAIYVYGDKKNDHGLYSVVLDNNTAEVFDGVSGCGGAFGMTCELQAPTLNYFASNLDGSPHTIRIENIAGVNNSFFDLDSIVVTVPSVYAPRQLNSSTPTSSSISPGLSSTATNSAISLYIFNLPLALCFIWLFRSFIFCRHFI